MSDPMHTRMCLTGGNLTCPSVSVFLVPEPLVRGGYILHLLEQAPVRDRKPVPDAELIALIEATSAPLGARDLVHAHEQAYTGPRHDPTAAREVLHDHLIEDPEPGGLDIDDPVELDRLSQLPEHPIGPRRIEDFQSFAMRQAMAAVYRHFAVDQRIPLLYHGFADPAEGWFALRVSAA